MKASETSEITIISSYSPINKRQTSLEFRQDLWKSNFTKFRSQISFRYVCVFKEVCKPLFHFYFAKSCFVNIITGCGLISRASLEEDHFSISQEARIAFGYTSSNSYASLVPSKLPACFIYERTADVWTNCFITFSTRWKFFFSRDLRWAWTIGIWSTLALLNLIRQIY